MKKRILFALILMGFTSLVVQVLLIREFLISFYGNELIIGIILANWIILEAIGSGLTSKISLRAKSPYLIYVLLQLGICLYLPISVYLIRIIKTALNLTAGEGVGILPVFLTSFFILAPLSIFDGSQFPFGCRIWSDFSKRRVESAGKVYILEAVGFILAGPVFTYLLITRLQSFQIAFILGLLNLVSGILLLKFVPKHIFKKILFTGLILISAVYVLSFFGMLERLHWTSINRQWKNQKVLDYYNSIYANLVVSESQGQFTFYSDGVPIITAPIPDITFSEEFAHFTLLAHNKPEDILLLSGGAGGLINEILKYPIKRLDYAELDPILIKLIKKYPTSLTQEELSHPLLNIKHIDGRRFIRLTESQYDAILINLPLPSTLQLNRFYTQDFFKDIKSKLKKQGIFSFTLPGSLSYISDELRNLNGSILNTLKEEFNYVKVIPGDFNIYLASQNKFTISKQTFTRGLNEKKIKTKLISLRHLDYRLDPYWVNWFNSKLGDTSKIRKNSDLFPSGVFYSLSYWNALFSPRFKLLFKIIDRLNFYIMLLFFSLLGSGLFLFQRLSAKKRIPIGFAIASSGFIGMSLNLILIFAYQSFYGFVFAHLALLTTAFMAGLTLGGWLMTRNLNQIRRNLSVFWKLELAIIGLCLIVAPLLIYLNRSAFWRFSFIFFLLSGISGLLVGLEFPLANKIWQKDKGVKHAAGLLYSLDLVGAWFASILLCLALVPVIGILNTCLLLACLKVISLILVIT